MSDTNQGVLAQHNAALAEGRFLIQKCGDCGQHIYFPREVCPHCGSNDLALVAPTGLGTVYSVTTVRRKPDAGGDYNVCLIDLDEGVRLMSRVETSPADAVQVGQRVQARVVLEKDQGVVVFDPVNTPATSAKPVPRGPAASAAVHSSSGLKALRGSSSRLLRSVRHDLRNVSWSRLLPETVIQRNLTYVADYRIRCELFAIRPITMR